MADPPQILFPHVWQNFLEKNNNDNKKRLKECDKNLAETQVRLSSFNPRKRKVHITPEVGETIVYFRFLPNGLFALLGTKNLLFKIQVLCCQERGEHLLLVVCFYLVPMISVLFGKKNMVQHPDGL